MKIKLNFLASFEDREIKKKKNQIEASIFNFKKSASILNDKKRNKALPFFKKDSESHLMNLGMPYAQFGVEFSEGDTFIKTRKYINFFPYFQQIREIHLLEVSKVASGGELSRFMLAIKYISATSSER